jgi:hypothetical protein
VRRARDDAGTWYGLSRDQTLHAKIAAHARAPAEAHRLGVLAGCCSLGQLLLALIAVGLGRYVLSRREIPSVAKWANRVGLVLGVIALLMMLGLAGS